MSTRKWAIFILVALAIPTIGQAFSFVVMPDTQNYARRYPHIFHAQTDWIARNKQREDIRFVLHEGDIVEGRTSDREWDVARDAMNRLDGIVPYFLAVGNHDFIMPQRDTTFFHRYFPYSKYAARPQFGGSFRQGSMSNAYFTTRQDGVDILIISLEYCPQREAVSWANSGVEAHPDHVAILLTHVYLGDNGARTGGGCSARFPNGNYTDGSGLWNRLVRKHKNFAFVFSGHITTSLGASYSRATGDHGNTVHQIMTNFQTWTNGGNGYLKILTVNLTDREVKVRTYSPHLNRPLAGSRHNFTISNFRPASYVE